MVQQRTHLQKLPTHVHADEIALLGKRLEAVPQGGTRGACYGGGFEAPEGEQERLVGFKGEDAGLAAANSVVHALGGCEGEWSERSEAGGRHGGWEEDG